MKPILSFLFVLSVSITLYAQEPVIQGGHFEASFNPASSMLSYQPVGEIPLDGIAVINLKEAALVAYEKENFSLESAEAIVRERESLEQLRHRILTQRERMMKPLPPMKELDAKRR